MEQGCFLTSSYVLFLHQSYPLLLQELNDAIRAFLSLKPLRNCHRLDTRYCFLCYPLDLITLFLTPHRCSKLEKSCQQYELTEVFDVAIARFRWDSSAKLRTAELGSTSISGLFLSHIVFTSPMPVHILMISFELMAPSKSSLGPPKCGRSLVHQQNTRLRRTFGILNILDRVSLSYILNKTTNNELCSLRDFIDCTQLVGTFWSHSRARLRRDGYS
jgi:hypothetical protein